MNENEHSMERQLRRYFNARAERLGREHPVTQTTIDAALDVAEAVRDGKLSEDEIPLALKRLRETGSMYERSLLEPSAKSAPKQRAANIAWFEWLRERWVWLAVPAAALLIVSFVLISLGPKPPGGTSGVLIAEATMGQTRGGLAAIQALSTGRLELRLKAEQPLKVELLTTNGVFEATLAPLPSSNQLTMVFQLVLTARPPGAQAIDLEDAQLRVLLRKQITGPLTTADVRSGDLTAAIMIDGRQVARLDRQFVHAAP